MEYKPIARSSDIVVQEVGDESLVYDLKNHRAKCLNETSAMVWKLCDGKKTALEITMALSAKLKTKIDENLVFLAFDQLQQEGLLEADDELTLILGGTSRRDLIKKAGMAAVIALPVVTGVIAPKAVHAQSFEPCGPGAGLNCVCSTGAGNLGEPSCEEACETVHGK